MISFDFTDPFILTFLLLLLCMLIAMIRVLLGPTTPDYGAAFNEIIYIDVAIVYALLSFITTLFIAKYLEGGKL